MAKEKRAFEDESLQDTPLREELNVTGREATNVMPMAEAEATKSSIFFNPKIFEDLATISRNVHDTRRNREAYEFALEQDQFKREQELLQDKWAITKKREQDNYLSEAEVAYVTTMEDEFQKAVRENKNALETVTATDSMFQKLGDAMWEKSPYLGEAFHKSRQDMFQKFNKRAIESDYVKSEAKAQYNFDTKANIVANNLRISTNEKMGEAGTQTESYTVRDAVDDLPKHLFPYLDTLSDSKWSESVNNSYNTVLRAEVDRIVEAFETGSMDIISARNQLLNLRAEYSYQDLTGPLNKAGEEERLASIRVSMDESTQKYLKQALLSLDNGQNKNISAHYFDTFYSATNGSDITAGKATITPYLRSNSYGDILNAIDEQNNIGLALIQAGASNAKAQYKKFRMYADCELKPTAAVIAVFKNEQAKTGKTAEAMRTLYNLKREISAMRSNPSIEKSPGLMLYDSSGTVLADLNFSLTPEQVSLMYEGQNTYEQVRGEYLDKMYSTIDNLEKSYRSNGGLVSTNRYVNDARLAASQSNVMENAIRKDPKTGAVEMRVDTLPSAVASTKNYIETAKIYGGDEDALSAVVDIIKDSGESIKDHTDPRIKAATAARTALVLKMAGYTDPLNNVDAEKAGIDSEYLQDVQTFHLLANVDELGIKQIIAADNDPDMINSRDIKDLSIFEKHDGGNYKTALAYVEHELLKVPIERRAVYRRAVVRRAIAHYQHAKTDLDKYKMPIKSICETIIDGNTTENGTYKHAAMFREVISVDEAEALTKRTSDKLEKATKRLNLPSDVAFVAEINESSGEMVFKVAGVQMNAEGYEKSLAGTGVYQLGIPLTKPKGMTDAEYEEATDALVTATGIAATVSTITSPVKGFGPELDDIRNKKSKQALEMRTGKSSRDMHQSAIQFLNTIQDPDFVKAWYNYSKSNGDNLKITKAHPDAKKELDALFTISEPQPRYLNTRTTQVKPIVANELELKDRRLMEKFTDFYYSYGVGDKVLRLDRPANTEAASKGIPQRDIQQEINLAGGGGLFRVTSTNQGKHATGVHAEGKAIDVGFGSKPEDWQSMYYASGPNAGKVNIEKLRVFLRAIQPWVENGSIDKIVVGSDMIDLVKGLGNDEDYAIFRKLTSKKGERLFRLVQPEIEKKYNHNNHFHIQFNDVIINKDGTTFNPVQKLEKAIAERNKKDSAISKTIDQAVDTFRGDSYTGQMNQLKGKYFDFLLPDARNLVNDTAESVYTNMNTRSRRIVLSRPEAKSVATLYGTRKATEWDAKHSGRTVEELNESYFTQTMAQANRYAIYKYNLGYENAVYAMEGCKFKFYQGNKEYSAEELVDHLLNNPKDRNKRFYPILLNKKGKAAYTMAFKLFERVGY